MKHGIEVFLGPKREDWVFVEAETREEAEKLQVESQDILPTRRAILTDEGNVVAVFATE